MTFEMSRIQVSFQMQIGNFFLNKKNGAQKMKIVTLNLPDQYLDCFDTMVNMGYFPSRSEAVRQAIKQFLVNENELNKDLNPERFRALKQCQSEALMQYM